MNYLFLEEIKYSEINFCLGGFFTLKLNICFIIFFSVADIDTTFSTLEKRILVVLTRLNKIVCNIQTLK